MPYQAEISRRNPTCILFLIDQSGSMDENFGDDSGIQKKTFLADALNRTLYNLVFACAQAEGVYDRFDVGVLGYGVAVGNVLTGPTSDPELIPISTVANNPVRVETRTKREPDGVGGIVEVEAKFPIWLDPAANGGTPMCEALTRAEALLRAWIEEHRAAYPPIVLHITDGESTDGDPRPASEELRTLETADGKVLLFNIHVSAVRSSPIFFPGNTELLPADAFARTLYEMSSIVPDKIRELARLDSHYITENAHGYVYNAGIPELVSFLDIGTRGLR